MERLKCSSASSSMLTWCFSRQACCWSGRCRSRSPRRREFSPEPSNRDTEQARPGRPACGLGTPPWIGRAMRSVAQAQTANVVSLPGARSSSWSRPLRVTTCQPTRRTDLPATGGTDPSVARDHRGRGAGRTVRPAPIPPASCRNSPAGRNWSWWPAPDWPSRAQPASPETASGLAAPPRARRRHQSSRT